MFLFEDHPWLLVVFVSILIATYDSLKWCIREVWKRGQSPVSKQPQR